MELYNQLAVLSTIDSELNAYEKFSKAENAVGGTENFSLNSKSVVLPGTCIKKGPTDIQIGSGVSGNNKKKY